jgi:hypothetical protein
MLAVFGWEGVRCNTTKSQGSNVGGVEALATRERISRIPLLVDHFCSIIHKNSEWPEIRDLVPGCVSELQEIGIFDRFMRHGR